VSGVPHFFVLLDILDNMWHTAQFKQHFSIQFSLNATNEEEILQNSSILYCLKWALESASVDSALALPYTTANLFNHHL